MRPNRDSRVHQPEVAAVTMVHRDAADSAEASEAAWLLVVEAEVVKSMFPTFVTSFLSTFRLVLSDFVDSMC